MCVYEKGNERKPLSLNLLLQMFYGEINRILYEINYLKLMQFKMIQILVTKLQEQLQKEDFNFYVGLILKNFNSMLVYNYLNMQHFQLNSFIIWKFIPEK